MKVPLPAFCFRLAGTRLQARSLAHALWRRPKLPKPRRKIERPPATRRRWASALLSWLALLMFSVPDDLPAQTLPELGLAPVNAFVVEGQTLEFRLSSNETLAAPITLRYRTEQSPGGDLLASTTRSLLAVGHNELRLPAGFQGGTLSVRTAADAVPESNAVVTVTLLSGSGYTMAPGGVNASALVLDDDSEPFVLVQNASEAMEGGSNIFPVSLYPEASGRTITVKYNTNDGVKEHPARAPQDYVHTTGILTFLPGQLTQAVTVQTRNNDTREETEVYHLVIGVPVNARLKGGASLADGIILDDDDPRLSITVIGNASAISEGETASFFITPAGGGVALDLSVRVLIENPPVVRIATYAVALGTANGGARVTVPTINDAVYQGERTVSATLLHYARGTANLGAPGATPYRIGERESAWVRLTDEEDRPQLSASALGARAGEAAEIVLALSRKSALPVAVEYATHADSTGSAVAGRDYTAASGLLTFRPGEERRTLRIETASVDAANPKRTFAFRILSLRIGSAPPADAGHADVSVAIFSERAARNVKPVVSISAGPVKITEGETAAFIISSAEALAWDLPVQVALSDPAAPTPDADAVARFTDSPPTRVVIPSGYTTAVLSIPTVDDRADEPDGKLQATLQVADDSPYTVAASGWRTYARIDVQDNDQAPGDSPVVSIFTDGDVVEGGTLVFRIVSTPTTLQALETVLTPTLNPDAPLGPRIGITTLHGIESAQGLEYKLTGKDAHGGFAGQLRVPTKDNAQNEKHGEYRLTLSIPGSRGTVDPNAATASALILDNDGDPPPLTLPVSAQVDEGAGSAEVLAQLKFQPGSTITVDYATKDGSALAGADYRAVSGTLTFLPGVGGAMPSLTVRVPILEDSVVENPETLQLRFHNPQPPDLKITGGATELTHVLTIAENDRVRLSVRPLRTFLDEGEVNVAAFEIVAENVVQAKSLTVNLRTQRITRVGRGNESAIAALSGDPGFTRRVVNHTASEDAIDTGDANEAVLALLEGPGYDIAQGTARIPVRDNDRPTFTVLAQAPEVLEGRPGHFDVVASLQSLSRDVYLALRITETRPPSVWSARRTLRIPAGSNARRLTVQTRPESGWGAGSDGELRVELIEDTDPSPALAGYRLPALPIERRASMPIRALPALTIAPADPVHGSAGVAEGEKAIFTVTASRVLGEALTVGMAVAGTDARIGKAPASLVIPGGARAASYVVTTNGNDKHEPHSAVQALLQPDGASLARFVLGAPSRATILVNDDDDLECCSVTVHGLSAGAPVAAGGVSEGLSEAQLEFVVTCCENGNSGHEPLHRPGLVPYRFISARTPAATLGLDYALSPQSGSLTFLPGGVVHRTLTVAVLDDALDEADTEWLTLQLDVDQATNFSGQPVAGLGGIHDDDLPELSIAAVPASVAEGGAATFTITADVAPARNLTIALTGTGNEFLTGDLPTMLTLSAGEKTATFAVTAYTNDADDEGGTVTVTLSAADETATGYRVGAASIATLAVTDDEVPELSITVSPASVAEGGTAVFTLAADIAPAENLTVALTGAGNEFLSGPLPATATIPAGATTVTFAVIAYTNDSDDEGGRVSVALNSPNEAAPRYRVRHGAASIADLTITDDDVPELSIAVSPASIAEGATATFTITADMAPVQNLTVAMSGTGSEFLNGTLPTIATVTAGTNTATFAVTAYTNDVDDEGGAVTVTLSPADATANGYRIGLTSSATLAIADDEGMAILSVANTTAAEAEANLEFVVRLSPASDRQVTVAYATANGSPTDSSAPSATAGDDYTATNGTLNFTAGETVKTVAVPLLEDSLDEPATEHLTLTLSNPMNAALQGGSLTLVATGSIADDDVPELSIAVSPASIAEGASATFTLTADIAPVQSLTIALTGSGKEFLEGTFPTTVTMTAGANTATFAVTAYSNSIDDEGGAVTVTLSAADETATGYRVGTASAAALSITDDEGMATLNVANATATEAEPNLGFVVTLTPASGQQVTVQYATANGSPTDSMTPSATAGDDYTATNGIMSFAAGETEKTISVPVLDDTLDELAIEHLTLTLSNAMNAALQGGSLTLAATGGITDDDVPELSIAASPASIAEGATATFTVNADIAPVQNLTITLTGTGDEFLNGTLPTMTTITAGVNTATFAVTAYTNDLDDEGGTATVTLSAEDKNITGYRVGATSAATLTITDDEGAATLSVTNATAAESERYLEFVVTLTPASNRQITVQYATADGSSTDPSTPPASAGDDYTATYGTLNFATGETRKTVTVPIRDDSLDEPAIEHLTLTLSNAMNAALQGGSLTLAATGGITDDDVPELSIAASPTTVAEGGTATFTITANIAPVQNLTIALTGTGNEFIDGTLPTMATMTAGANTEPFTVTTYTNEVDDEGGTVTATLSAADATATGYRVGTTNMATLIITDDESMATLSVATATAVETDSNLEFVVTLTPASNRAVTVQYATANGSPTDSTVPSATADDDYMATNGTLNFAAGETIKTVLVPILNDMQDEVATEHLTLTLSSAMNAALQGGDSILAATGSITDDDVPRLSIVVSPASVAEGAAATFTISADIAPVQSFTIAMTDTGAEFIEGALPTTATMIAGANTATFVVTAYTNAIDDEGGTVTVTLSAADATATGYRVGTTNTATLTVTDDESIATLSVSNATAAEAEANLEFVVTLTPASNRAVTVQYATANGTSSDSSAPSATAGDDYTATNGALSFTAGETLKTISVSLLDDTLDEPATEHLTLTLSSAMNAALQGGSATLAATGSIADDDVPELSITVIPPRIVEGASATFTITADIAPAQDLTIALSGVGDEFLNGALPTRATMAAGTKTAAFAVIAYSNDIDDPGGAVTVSLGKTEESATGAPQGPASAATLAISDDDEASRPAVAIQPTAQALEGQPLRFMVGLSNASGQVVIVRYATVDGVAAAAALEGDGHETGASAGSSASTAGANDGYDTGASAGTSASTEGEGDGNDAGAAPTEGDGDAASSRAVAAIAGEDYAAVQNGRLTFLPGQVQQPITIPTHDDAHHEAEEFLTLRLTGADHADLAAAHTAIGAIQDNDASPVVYILEDMAAPESGNLVFTVRLAGETRQTASVRYGTSDGPGEKGARAGEDYLAASGILTFLPGESSHAVTVTVRDDQDIEDDESLILALSAPQNAALEETPASQSATAHRTNGSGHLAIGTIMDNDRPTLSCIVQPQSLVEGSSAAFILQASFAPSIDLTVNLSYSQEGEFVAQELPAQVTLSAGATRASMTVATVDDEVPERAGSLTSTLLPGYGYLQGAPEAATLAIQDNDGLSEDRGEAINAAILPHLASALGAETSALTADRVRSALGPRSHPEPQPQGLQIRGATPNPSPRASKSAAPPRWTS